MKSVAGRYFVPAALLAVLLVFREGSGVVARAAPCEFENVERIVAVGDVHGAYDRLLEILRAAEVIDARNKWIGGKTHLVQTGDVLDRGPDSRKALEFLRSLTREANSAGGRVHALLGNHEVMRLVGDYRYVVPGEYAAFADSNSAELRRTLLERMPAADRPALEADTPLGKIEMMRAFAPGQNLGSYLRELNAVVRINGVLFLHGGISPAVSSMSCAAINDTIHRDLGQNFEKTKQGDPAFTTREDGPLWYRGLAEEPDSFAPEVDKILAAQKARAIVMAHTVQAGPIRVRFDRKVFLIDTGMQPAYVPDGRASALEIRGNVFTAIYKDARQVIAGGDAPVAPVEKPATDAATLAARKREAERLRLFRSEDPIVATLTADFRAVQRDRNPQSTETFPATIVFETGEGKTATMPLRIRTRGHSRRNVIVCSFAPLRLEFDKTVTKGSLFDGHGGLKLGTHCRRGAEDVVVREYAIYKMFNILTPRSFRARLAKMTYVDSGTGRQIAQEAGLFIEDDDDVAKRLEGRSIELDKAVFARVDQESLTLVMLFEYMIGNTDVSLFNQHNIRIVQTPNIRRYPVPYDFDYSGLADSGYGQVARGLPIASVRDRLYRGPCRTLAEWQPYLEKVKAAKPQLLAVFDTVEGLSPGYRRSAKAYLEEFYKTINQPSMVKKELIDNCSKAGT